MASADGTTVHTYLYDNSGALIRETRDYPDGTQDIMEFLYDQSGRPYAFVLNNVTYYYVLNLQGDIVRLVNTAGTTVVSYVYNAWGKILSTQTTSLSYSATVAAKNPLRYRGYYYDTETQLYYCQSRYYDPATGRFLNADAFTSTGQGILGNNMFAYCNNNPVNCSDPSGNLMVGVFQGVVDGCRGFGGGYVPPQSVLSGNRKKIKLPINFALVEEITEVKAGTKTACFLAGSFDAYSFDDGGFNLLSLDASVVSLDLENEDWGLDLFDLGNASASVGINILPYASALVSLWSPSVKFSALGKTIEFSLHFGALGYGAKLAGPEKQIDYAPCGYGFSLKII